MKDSCGGPMSHYPQMNFPAFDAAAKDLRERGHEVISPAELDSPAARAAALSSVDGDPAGYALGDTWGKLLARDVELIADDGIEAIVVLPGRLESRGAKLESYVGRLCGLPILQYPSLEEVCPQEVDIAHGYSSPKPKRVVTFVPSEVRMVNEKTGGEKGSKRERYDLIPWEPMDEVARLYERGAAKYSEHNWCKGYAWKLSFSSLIRHAVAFWQGEDIDPETECDHMASVVFHALALMYFRKHHPDLDDRGTDAVPS